MPPLWFLPPWLRGMAFTFSHHPACPRPAPPAPRSASGRNCPEGLPLRRGSPRGSGHSPARGSPPVLCGGTAATPPQSSRSGRAATNRVTRGCPPLTHSGDDLRRRPPQPNRAFGRQPAASQPPDWALFKARGARPTPSSHAECSLRPSPARAPLRATDMPGRRPLQWGSPAPSRPRPSPCPFSDGPTSAHAPARRPWLPAAGRARAPEPEEKGDVCPAKRPRGAAAAGSGGAITTASLFPAPEPQTSEAILFLTTNFLGSRRRQRCRAPQLPRPRRRRYQLGARGSPPLRSVAQPGSVGSARARARGKALGLGCGEGGCPAGRGTGPPRGPRPRAQLHPARPPRPALYPARRAPGRRRRGSRPSHRLL